MKSNHSLTSVLVITLISILAGCSNSTSTVTETFVQTQTLTHIQTQTQTLISTQTQTTTITSSDITTNVDQTTTVTTIPTTTSQVVPTSSPPPTSESPTTSSSPIPTTTTDANNIDFTDSTGDTFDDTGKPIQVESYFDIVRAEVNLIGSNYLFQMRVNGEIPLAFTNPNVAAEWDFFIDADRTSATGTANPIFVNDIGAEYMVRLLIHGAQIKTELINLTTLESFSITSMIDGDTIELSFNWTLMQELQNFDYIALARSWLNNSLIAADKAPNAGHHSFST